MKNKICFLVVCTFLLVSISSVYANLLDSVPQSNNNPYSTTAGSFSGSENNLGGFVYNDPIGDIARKYGRGYGYGQDVYLGESIIVNIADYQPKQVRESLLEQSNVPVFFYLKGTTIGTALSPFTNDPSARDPLSGITNIPKITDIQVRVNSTSADGFNYISGVPVYFPPRPDRYSLNNLGALVVYLNKIEDESNLPKNNNIILDMNARIYFNLEDTSPFGISQQDLTLKQFGNEKEFFGNPHEKESSSFFSGKGYIRAVSIDRNGAVFQVYDKQLYPLALYNSQSSGLGTSLSAISSFRLSPSDPVKLVRIDSTGNPLRDVVQIKLNNIVIPADNAQFEFSINGIDSVRKINVGQSVYRGSDWILEKVDIDKPKGELNKNDLNSPNFRNEYGVDDESLNLLNALISSSTKLYDSEIIVTLNNPKTGRKVIRKKAILDMADNSPVYISIPDENTVKILEHYYCNIDNSEKPYKSNEDYACNAVANYKTIIDAYPDSVQINDALKGIATIYEKNLISYTGCNTPLSSQCVAFKSDMRRLSLYYYTKAGVSDYVTEKLMSIGGEDYLEDEGVGLKLLNAHKVSKSDFGEFDYVVNNFGESVSEEKSFKVGDILKNNDNVNVLLTSVTDNKESTYFWVVESINPSSVIFRLYSTKKDSGGLSSLILDKAQSRTISMQLNSPSDIVTKFAKVNPITNTKDGEDEVINLEITRIDTKLEAYVTVIPGAGRGVIDSNFKIHIPIDPRPFKWTPEQLKSQIEKSRDAINTLNEMVDKMDNIVSTWKKACLGTFAFLTLKNSIGQGPARNIARKQVTSFFRSRCENEVSRGINNFDTVDECLNHYGDDIKKATDDTESVLGNVNSDLNEKIEDIKIDNTECKKFSVYLDAARSSGLTDNEIKQNYGDCLSSSKLLKQYDKDKTAYGRYIMENSNMIDVNNAVSDSEKADSLLSMKGIDNKNPKWKDLKSQAISSIQRARETASKSKDNNILDNLIITESDKNSPLILKGVTFSEVKTAAGISVVPVKVSVISQYDYRNKLDGSANKLTEELCKSNGGTIIGNNGCNVNINAVIEQSKKIAAVDPVLGQIYIADEFLDKNKEIIISQIPMSKSDCDVIHGEFKDNACAFSAEKSFVRSAIQVDSGGRSTSNTYTGNDLEAMYDNEGLVYCYPTDKGNYVRVMERYPTGAKAIKDIRLYNVGPNGKIECGGGDDVIIKNEGELNIPDNSKSKNDLVRAGESLGRCVKDGDKVGTNNLFGKVIRCNTKFADSLINSVEPKCIDVMDPSDCKLLFNACDPVMCPSSRCTLGGRVPPRNVIQSGIIGSTILCFPNINQGIVVPICLTGVDAGLKNVRSLVQSYNDCLQIKLERNEDVGFCDYIRSVGVCEIMWREAASLVNIGGGLIDYTSGKLFSEPDGGQEYLKFQSAFKNVGDTVNFFTQEYKDTYTAQFLGQSTEEIGSQICRLSVNGKFPNVGDILDQLTEPENPPQFTAFFDEAPYANPGEIASAASTGSSYIPMNTNELSLYKVFYHIYAGTGYYGGVYSQPQSLLGSGTPSQIQQPIIYSVYLVNPQLGLSPLYVTFRDDETFGGFQGNVESGKYVQKSVQKVGPVGYNQICVNINGQISCGFGKVGSAFGLQELQDVITQKEVESGDIKTATECVSTLSNSPSASIARLAAVGGTSALGGVDTSIGSSGLSIGEGTSPLIGLSTSGIDQSILSNGIVRVCAISPPTPEINRWTVVGSCGQDNLNKDLGDCWLDRNSINTNDKNINQDLLNKLRQRGDISDFGLEIIDPDVSRAALLALNERNKEIIEHISDLVNDAKKKNDIDVKTTSSTNIPQEDMTA